MKPDFAIELEIGDEKKYSRIHDLVRRIAVSKARGPTSNLDLCYYLDCEKKESVNFRKVNINGFPKIVEFTGGLNAKILNDILGTLYGIPHSYPIILG
jgi:hypothetical protein